LLFPLLAVDALIFGLVWLVIKLLIVGQPGDMLTIGYELGMFFALWLCLATLLSLLVDWLIIRRVWRAVNKIGAGISPVEPARKNSLGKIIAIGCGVMLALAILLIGLVHSVKNSTLRAASLTSADFHYQVFEADAALVDRLIPAAQRKPGVQSTAKFLARYSPGETQKTVGSGTNTFIVTKHVNEDTDSQVAVINLDTLHELLEGIATQPGVFVNQSQTVTGIWWPQGTQRAGYTADKRMVGL